MKMTQGSERSLRPSPPGLEKRTPQRPAPLIRALSLRPRPRPRAIHPRDCPVAYFHFEAVRFNTAHKHPVARPGGKGVPRVIGSGFRVGDGLFVKGCAQEAGGVPRGLAFMPSPRAQSR